MKNDLICKGVTIIDPATGWLEIHQYNDKRSTTVANIAEQKWFSKYPWLTQITYNRGIAFIGKDFQSMIKSEYGIKETNNNGKKPTSNAIVERVHKVIGNIIQTLELEVTIWIKIILGKESLVCNCFCI
jgi:transposase InsO family protein